MRLPLVALILGLILPRLAVAQDMLPLLTLQQLTDGKITAQITVLGSQIDPNTRSRDDRVEARINGRAIRIPNTVLTQLVTARRAFSYDHFTKGIKNTDRRAVCMMGGPSQGWVLSTRYLIYTDHQITAHDMVPVLSAPGNCLFTQQIAPKDADAHIAAAKTFGALQTLLALH